MALNPFQYDAAIEWINGEFNKFKSASKYNSKKHRKVIDKWDTLSHDEKVEAISLLEEIQNITIAKRMMNCDNEISIPRIGIFKYDLGKFYYHNNKEELKKLDFKERIIKIGIYKKANYKKYNIRHNGKVISITKAPTKR